MPDGTFELLLGAVNDLRDEVQGYRKELNGRLRVLENESAANRALAERNSKLIRWAGGISGSVFLMFIGLIIHS